MQLSRQQMVKMMTNINNQLALAASIDEKDREALIRENQLRILRFASSVCRRYITTGDDEWSVALCAFSRAVDLYSGDRGDFLPFAQMLIKRDLIDYYRCEKKRQAEISIAPHVLEGNGEPEEDTQGVYLAIVRSSKESASNTLQEEILAANDLLETYGFRFFDLIKCSPQQDKTKAECAKAVHHLLVQQELFEEMERTHKLPVKALAQNSTVSKKVLDRYRKYIIMAALILKGDFPQIAEYLKFMKEDPT